MSDYKDTGLDEFGMPLNSPITAGTVSASAMDYASTNERNSVGNYFLQSFNFGKGQGGTITLGGTANGDGVMQVKSSDGSLVIQADNEGHKYYDGSGNEIVRINTGGMFVYGTVTDAITLQTSSNGTIFGNIGYHPTFGFLIQSAGTQIMFLYSPSNAYLISEAADVVIESGSAKEVTVFNAGNSGTVNIFGGRDVEIYAATHDVNITADNNVNMICTDFKVNGVDYKTAVVPTSKGYRALYTTESPEVWFMDFVEDKSKPDAMFMEVTEAPYKYIQCDDGSYQMWGKRKGAGTVRFDMRTPIEYEANNRFWSTPRVHAQGIKATKEATLRSKMAGKNVRIAQLENKLDNKLDEDK